MNRRSAEAYLRASEGRHRIVLEEIEEDYIEVDLAGNATFFNN